MQFPWAAHNWPEAMMLLLSSEATSSASSFFFLYFWHIFNVILPGLKQSTVVHETKENNYKHLPHQTIKWVNLKQNYKTQAISTKCEDVIATKNTSDKNFFLLEPPKQWERIN